MIVNLINSNGNIMTSKQIAQFNKMAKALTEIARGYDSLSMLKRKSGQHLGQDYSSLLESNYRSIIAQARAALSGVEVEKIKQ